MFRTKAVRQARLQICFQRRTGAPQKVHQHNQVRLWRGLWHVHQNRKETRQTEWKIREIASKEDKLSNYHHFNGFRRVQWGKRINQGPFLDKLWIRNTSFSVTNQDWLPPKCQDPTYSLWHSWQLLGGFPLRRPSRSVWRVHFWQLRLAKWQKGRSRYRVLTAAKSVLFGLLFVANDGLELSEATSDTIALEAT